MIGDADVGEEDLAEVGGAGHLPDRPDLDAGALHVDEEESQTFVLGQRGVVARHHDAPVRVVRARGPDLLAVHHPVVAVTHRAHAQAGEVGAAGRLGEELAPDLLAADQLREVAALLLLGGVHHHHRRAHAEADAEVADRHVVLGLFLFEDHVVEDRQTLAAVLLGEVHDGVAGVGLLRLPLPGLGESALGVDATVEAAAALPRLGVLLEPGADLGAKLGFYGAVVEVHVNPLTPF